MNEKINAKLTELLKKIEDLSTEIVGIIQCLEVMENSLYFAGERKDKDMTMPCAAATEMIINMLNSSWQCLEDIGHECKELTED